MDATQYLPMMGGPTATYTDMSYAHYPTPSPDSVASKSPEYTMLGGNGNSTLNAAFLEDFGSMNCRNAQCSPGPFAGVHLKILEQPVEKFRFRYRSEMSGTHGSLQGASSEKNRKATYPTVQLKNYNGPATIRCSLYTYSKEIPEHRRQPHPHRLVMKNEAEDRVDPHDKHIDPQSTPGLKVVFKNMGIIHTAKKHIQDELRIKHTKLKLEEVRRLEPGRALTTREESDIKRMINDEEKSINLNVVCLRFDAFRVDSNGIYQHICEPLYSNPIFNLKSAMTGDLKIVRMDHSTSPASGGKEIFLLVEKVAKKNIKVQIFEIDSNDDKIWSAEAKFHETDVHHQYAIVVKTPPYKNPNIDEPTKDVFIALSRPSDGECSEPRPFTYTPDRANKRKRGRYDDYTSSSSLSMEMQQQQPQIPHMIFNYDQPMITSEELFRVVPEANSDEFNRMLPELMPELMNTFNVEQVSLQADAAPREEPQASMKDIQRIKKDYIQVGAYIKTQHKGIDSWIQKKFEEKSDDGNTILHLCFIHYNAEFAESLKTTLLGLIERYKLYDLLNIHNSNHETVLHIAIKNGPSQNQLKDLPLRHMKIGHRGQSPLHLAIECDYGLDELCIQLKEQGVLERINENGLTALQCAVEQQRETIVKKLIDYGAQANVQDNRHGNNILQTAVLLGNEELVKYLIENTKVNVENRNFQGKTADQLAKERLTKIKRYNILRILRPESTESNFELFEAALVKEEESSSDSEEEMELEIKTEDYDEDIDALPITFDSLKELAKITLDKTVIERLYNDLNFGYLLDSNAFEDRHPLEFLIHLALTNNVRVSEIRDTLLKHNITEAVECIDRLIKR